MFRLLSLVLVLSSTGLLAGCFGTGNSKFACPVEHGVTCMSAVDVYNATNHADEIVGVNPDEARELFANGRAAGHAANAGYVRRKGGVILPPEGAASRNRMAVPDSVHGMPASIPSHRASTGPLASLRVDGDTLAISGPGAGAFSGDRRSGSRHGSEPYRVPAKVMRIYIRPWQDRSGDLHMGGYIFSEIEPRKWSLTEPAPQTNKLFDFLGASTPAQDANMEASASSSAVTSSRAGQR